MAFPLVALVPFALQAAGRATARGVSGARNRNKRVEWYIL